jgi:hypothetical protein
MVDVEEAVREALGSPRRSPAPPKDLWADVQRRIRRRSRRRRALAGAAAGVLATVGVTALATTAGDGGGRSESRVIDAGPGPAATTGAPSAVGGPEVDPQWEEIEPPTIAARSGESVTPAGDKVILWGGRTIEDEPDEPDEPGEPGAASGTTTGLAYYPFSRSWASISEAPITGRSEHVAVWTGTEVIVWGGHVEEDLRLIDGAAYDPSTGRWRSIAPAPLPPDRYSGVWTGSELIVVGGGEATVTGAAYDPATDAWRTVSPPPIALVRYQLAWTGQRVLAVGGERTGEATEQQFRALAYEPGSDTWVDLGGHEIASNEVAIAVTDGQLVVWSNGGDDTWRFDLATGAWSPGAPAPTTCEGADRAVGVPGAVIGAICGRGYRYDVAADTWTELDWPDDRWIVAGDQVFVPA